MISVVGIHVEFLQDHLGWKNRCHQTVLKSEYQVHSNLKRAVFIAVLFTELPVFYQKIMGYLNAVLKHLPPFEVRRDFSYYLHF